MSFDYEAYRQQLTETLRTFDKEEILAFFAKHNLPVPSSDQSFWGGVHKMRLDLPGFTQEEKEFSRHWLRSHGFQVKALVPENLQNHMKVFSAKFSEGQRRGLNEKEAGLEAAREANRMYPLTDEDKAALQVAGKARGLA